MSIFLYLNIVLTILFSLSEFSKFNNFDKLNTINLILTKFPDAYFYFSPIVNHKLFGYSISLNNIVFLIIILFVVFIFIKNKINEQQYKKYIDFQKLSKMNWEKYEELIKLIFEKQGYKVHRQGGHGSDGGIDLIVSKFGQSKSMVQCKRYSSKVGVKIVREMFAVGVHHNFKKVYIYTTMGFTKEAIEFAKGKNLILVDGVETIRQMKKYL